MLLALLVVAMLPIAHATATFDHRHPQLATFLSGAVSPRGVDYALLSTRTGVLDAYLDTVSHATIEGWSREQQLALYVNAYNAYTLKLMLDNGPPNSILDLDGGKVWDTRTFQVAGAALTLNQMEHAHARKLADGRVHAALNCASKGCPPLPDTPLTPSDVSTQLDRAARTWAATNAFTLTGNTIALSHIFEWYAQDFTAAKQGDLAGVDGPAENALWFLSRYVDDAARERLLSGALTVGWQDYDWTLNRR